MFAVSRSNDDDAIPAAVLTFLTTGGFGDVDEVASSTFTAQHASEALARISRARQDVQGDIASLSRNSASRVENWISQANQLHEELEHSRATAREIVTQHERGKVLQANITDIRSKINLLKRETTFNRTLTARFGDVKRIHGMLSRAREALRDGSALDDNLLNLIDDIEIAIADAAFPASTPLSTILHDDLSSLHKDISHLLLKQWESLVKVDRRRGLATVSDDSCKLGKIISSLFRVHLLDSVQDSLARDIAFLMISTIVHPENESRFLQIDNGRISVTSPTDEVTALDVFNGIKSTFQFLRERLPDDFFRVLLQRLSPPVISTLVSHKLTPSIPSGLPEMKKFQTVIQQVSEFSSALRDFGCLDIGDLSSWLQCIPQLWFEQRKASSLNDVRVALVSATHETRRIDRTEKELLANENTNTDAPGEDVADYREEDEWSVGWSDEDGEGQKDRSQQNPKPPADKDEDNEDDNWSWGDEEEKIEENIVSKPVDKHAATSAVSKTIDEEVRKSESKAVEVARTESYLITSIPDRIYRIMEQQVQDADAFRSGRYTQLPVAPVSNGVRSLPTELLAMFRALACLCHSQRLPAGQMYLSNDCSYLAERLRHFASVNSLPQFQVDIDTLERMGREAHDKEIMSQKVILRDLLDGTQGFSNCSSPLMRTECENAIGITVSRIRQLHDEWKPILTHTSLLQSTGSLLASIINKIIVDIEDLSDIVKSDSLVLVSLCEQISKLENLFLPQQNAVPPRDRSSDDAGDALVPTTAAYVPNWLKFQYLVNILESSLADIKYLWQEGGLQLDFTIDEVIDLVQALFAESPHRRKAIAELRES